ncbi:DUF4124 domain-containing protein [Rheinheimera baltica]|uniref:DUF4124 domain-containing protein n=1 Tax=Rheinheimera baltica TaxID=67576 RepID=A0ABT9I3T1_9GAMM|nr:DUF4124 domain-containing protein [Rheinheimera baltica]MDP5138040.1 DUF4124 domain-containing protein [Rheinheimera baltica]MDP5141968.1 DUF4124 domain-containing protein [Rheinheimera baltica]MDP5150043.1 DUF4124 domain-containing protein [Rheinheimera baltica]MDP5189725.1 DUF4124 domain-containing protein [Rheinheimera baltica]
MIGKLQVVTVLSCSLFFASFVVNAAIYTWVDEKGVTHYSQTKPNEVGEAKELNVNETKPVKFEGVKKNKTADTAKSADKNAKKSQKKSDECWRKGNSLGFLIEAADGLQGKEKADYVKMLSDQKRALEKECGKNSNAWSN